MNHIVKKFLDTKLEGPIRVQVHKSSNPKTVGMFCGGTLVITGTINSHPNYTYVHWEVTYSLFTEILKYIPVTKNVESDVVSWVRKRCKKEGIPFVSPTVYNLK